MGSIKRLPEGEREIMQRIWDETPPVERRTIERALGEKHSGPQHHPHLPDPADGEGLSLRGEGRPQQRLHPPYLPAGLSGRREPGPSGQALRRVPAELCRLPLRRRGLPGGDRRAPPDAGGGGAGMSITLLFRLAMGPGPRRGGGHRLCPQPPDGGRGAPGGRPEGRRGLRRSQHLRLYDRGLCPAGGVL